MIQPIKKLRQINKNVNFTTLNTWYCKIHNFTKSNFLFQSLLPKLVACFHHDITEQIQMQKFNTQKQTVTYC